MNDLLTGPVPFAEHPIGTAIYAIVLAFWCRAVFGWSRRVVGRWIERGRS